MIIYASVPLCLHGKPEVYCTTDSDGTNTHNNRTESYDLLDRNFLSLGNVILTLFAADNGFNPVWNEICEFDVINPHFALLRFVVQDEDVFGDSNFIGQATYSVSIKLHRHHVSIG